MVVSDMLLHCNQNVIIKTRRKSSYFALQTSLPFWNLSFPSYYAPSITHYYSQKLKKALFIMPVPCLEKPCHMIINWKWEVHVSLARTLSGWVTRQAIIPGSLWSCKFSDLTHVRCGSLSSWAQTDSWKVTPSSLWCSKPYPYLGWVMR